MLHNEVTVRQSYIGTQRWDKVRNLGLIFLTVITKKANSPNLFRMNLLSDDIL